MTDKIDWLDNHFDASTELSQLVEDIKFLAKGFKITGNTTMYRELMEIAKGVGDMAKIMRGALTESIIESINRSNASSKAILEAALAGAMSVPSVPSSKQKRGRKRV